jgi:putative membrane protein
LANERTFLAWIRTSLALLAGGVAVEAFMAAFFGPELRRTLAVLLLMLALFLSGGSFFRWINVERAMRQKAPLPLPLIAPLLAVGGALVGQQCFMGAKRTGVNFNKGDGIAPLAGRVGLFQF